MPVLAETQRLLWRLISAPEGVAAALALDRERGGGELASALARTVCGSGALGATERLDIYANMYFFRILDVLRDDFPGLTAVLGNTAFHNLVTDYLLACPPIHFSIRHVGDRLPAFIGTHAAQAARPFLEDLARFEAALTDAFDAADSATGSPADLAAVPAADWAAIRFRVHPSVRLLRCHWNVHSVRAEVDRGEAPSEPAPGPTHLRIWRQGFDVRHCAVDATEFEAIVMLREGAPFGEICGRANARADAVAPRFAAMLAGWLADGCIAGFDTEK
jgi:hypothetical protein